MTKLTVHTLWIWRKDEDGPELIEAWDAISVMDNHAGWLEACEKAIKSIGGDLSAYRYIDLSLPEANVLDAFSPPEVEAKVER